MATAIVPLLFPSLVAGSVGFNVAVAGVTAVLYAGVSAASILLQQSMLPNQRQEIGTKLKSVLGGAVNQSIIVGRKESAGSFIYTNNWGVSGRVPNSFLASVQCISDRPVEGFETYIWAGGRKCPYDPGETQTIDGVNLGHPIPAFRSNNKNRLWVKFYDGSQNSADGYLVSKFGSDPNRPWTADHVGRGRAYIIVTQKYDKKQPSGKVDVIAVPKFSKMYDWRDDGTNGGSGSQRYGQYGTYGFDNGNPVVTIYNIMRGIYYQNEWMYGGQGWPATRFDNDTWTAAANKSDENAAVAGGGTIKRYRMGAEIDLSEEPWTVIERCLKACNGRIVESGGVFKIYVGGVGASVFSFTDDDILTSEELTGRLFPSRESIVNTVTGTYIEPDSAGEPKAFKARTKQSYIDADGDVRMTSIDYEYVREARQAQRLASLALNDNRRFRTFAVPLWTQARKIEPCDAVTWTSERWGFTNKKFITGKPVLRHDGVVILPLREADDTDADWSPEDEDAYETGFFGDIDPSPQTLTPTVTATSITDDDDTTARRAALRIQAAIDDDYVDCRALLYQVRKRNGDKKVIYRGRSPEFFEEGNADYGDITFTASAFVPGKQVEVRVKIEPESDRETDWSDWIPITLSTTVNPEVSDIPPPDIASTPTMELVTRVHRSGAVRQRLMINLDTSGRDPKETYRVRVVDTSETPSELQRWTTGEFPFPVVVQSGHDYTVTVAPVSRFGVRGTFVAAEPDGFSMPIPKKGGGAVPPVENPTATAQHRRIIVECDPVDLDAYPDYSHTEIQSSGSPSFPAPTAGNTKTMRGTTFIDGGLGNNTQRYYRMRHKDSSGNPTGNGAGWSATVNATTPRLVTGDLAEGAVDNATLGPNAVDTPKIKPKSIEARFELSDIDGTSQNWDVVSKNKKIKHDLAGGRPKAVKIFNPNPSAVSLRISYVIKSRTTIEVPTGTPELHIYRGSRATLTVGLKIYSAPAGGGKATVVHEASVKSSLEGGKKRPIERLGSKKVSKLIAMDLYKGSAGDATPRIYWAETFYSLAILGEATVTGRGSVKKFKVEGSYSKR